MTPAPAARADDAAERQAETLFREGREAVARGDYIHGCPRFVESLKLTQRAGPMLNLAMCDEHEGRYRAARQHWERGIALLPTADERVTVAQSRVVALRKKTPQLTVKLTGDLPAGARVLLDGVGLDAGAIGAPQSLDPGKHTITLVVPGRAEAITPLTLADNEHKELYLSPSSAAVLGPAGAVDRDTPPSEGPSGRRVAGFVVGGVGLAILGVGVATGVMTIAKKSEVDKNCMVGCNQAARDAATAGKTLSTVSTVTFITGLAALGTGIALVATGGRGPGPAAPAVAMVVGPTVLPGGAGLGAVGSF